MKGKLFSRIIAVLLCLSVVFANLVFTVSASDETGQPIILVSGSDFQIDKSTTDAIDKEVTAGLFEAVSEDYPTIDGFLFAGDYTTDSTSTAALAGLNQLKTLLASYYSDVDNTIWVQGNHEPTDLVTDGTLTSSGAHDTDDYGVYVLNEDDYPAYGNHSVVYKTTAPALAAYLDEKVAAEYTKPIFIVSHIPLHYSYRTYKDKCALQSALLVDLMNEASEAGLNIIFMYGHNHNNGYDDYLGGDQVFLTKGDTINVPVCATEENWADAIENSTYDKETWKEQEIQFTYLNAGYTAAYYAGYGSTSTWDTSMVVYEITDDTVTFYRYGQDGIIRLKDQGQSANYTDDIAAYEPDINTVTYESGYVLNLTGENTSTEEDLHMRVDLLVNEKLGYSFYVYGDDLSDYANYEIVVEYGHYGIVDGVSYVETSNTVTYSSDESVTKVFTYEEVAAYEMMLDTTFTLNCYDQDGNLARRKQATITYASFLAKILSQLTSDQAAYIDLLNYGAAVQAYFASQNEGSDLANDTATYGLPTDIAGVSDYQQYATSDDLASAETADASFPREVDDETGASIYASLQIQSSNRIVFIAQPGDCEVEGNEENYYLNVYDTEGALIAENTLDVLEVGTIGTDGDTGYFYFPSEENAIPLYDTEAVLTAEFIGPDSDEPIITRNYSVEAFIANVMAVSDDDYLVALGDAIMKLTYSLNNRNTVSVTYTLEEVTEIEDDTSYILVNKATNQVWGTTYDSTNAVFPLGDAPTTETTDFWQFASGATGISYVNSDGTTTGYYQPNGLKSAGRSPITAATVCQINAAYDATEGAWLIGRYSNGGTYYFCADASTNTVLSTAKLTTPTEDCYWIIYQVVETTVNDGNVGGDIVDSDDDSVTYTLEEVTYDNIITEGSADYIIVNKSTNKVLTSTKSGNYLALGDAATADSTDLWTLEFYKVQNASTFTLRYYLPSSDGSYYNLGNGSVYTQTDKVGLYFIYDETNGWLIARSSSSAANGSYYYLTASDGNAYGYGGDISDASYWTIYQVVETTVGDDGSSGDGDDTGDDNSDNGDDSGDTGSDDETGNDSVLEGWTVLSDVTQIQEGETYIIASKSTNRIWTNTFSSSAFTLGDEPTADTEDLWQFSAGLAGLLVDNGDSDPTGYYQPNSSSISKASEGYLTVIYDDEAEAWLIYRAASSGKRYFFAADDTNNKVTYYAAALNADATEDCYWIIYGLTSKLPSVDDSEDEETDDPTTGANFSFAFTTDIHVGNGTDAAINVRKLYSDLAVIAEDGVELDTVLISGDLTQDSYQGEWETLTTIVQWFTPEGLTTFATMGNHDARSYDYSSSTRTDDERWADVWGKFQTFHAATTGMDLSVPYYHVEIPGHNGTTYDLVVLCTEGPEKDNSYLSDTQIAWFEETLESIEAKKGTHQNIIVMLHQPVNGTLYTLSSSGDHVGDANDTIKAIIAEHPQVVYISGHIHTSYTSGAIKDTGEGIYVDGISLYEEDYYRVIEIYDDYIQFRVRGIDGTWLTSYTQTIDTSNIGSDDIDNGDSGDSDDDDDGSDDSNTDSGDSGSVTYTLEEVTPDNIITDGSAEYIFVNNETGWVLDTTTTSVSAGPVVNAVTTGVTVDSPAWTVTPYSTNRYTISNGGTVTSLAPNNKNVGESASAPYMYYFEGKGWVIARLDDYIKYVLQPNTTAGYIYGYYANGSSEDKTITSTNYTSITDTAYWTIYQVVETTAGGDGSDNNEPVVETVLEYVDDELITLSSAEYLIVNKSTGTLLTATLTNSSLELSGEPAIDSDAFWTFDYYTTSNGYNRYYISTADGTYLKPNNNAVSLESSATGLYLIYDETEDAWLIGRASTSVTSGYYYLTAYSDSYAYGYGGDISDGSYWELYEVSTYTTSNWQSSTIEVAEAVETLSATSKTISAYDVLPVIRTAAEYLTVATATADNNVRFISDTTATAEAVSILRDATDDRIDEIINSANLTIPSGATVYYVSNSGSDSNNGTSSSTAWKTLDKVNSVSGSSTESTYVLFERGGVWRGQLNAKKYVTYSAYGTGDKPKIYASPFDGASDEYADNWTSYSTNIWSFQSDEFITDSGTVIGDIGTLIFNEGEACAIKIDDYGLTTIDVTAMLDSDLEFYHDYVTGTVYLYSTANPATRFDSIEFNVGNHIVTVASTDITIDNLCLKYTGAHGISSSGSVDGLTVQNCEIAWIGGSIHAIGSSKYTRYGNGIEVWGAKCIDFTVCGNYIYQIYDAGITQQFTPSGSQELANENIIYSGNVLEYCNYSIEYWMSSTQDDEYEISNFVIEDNYMWYAGSGLCEQRPDTGNASHINGWRTEGRNRAINYVIRNNVMVDSYNYMFGIYSTATNSDGENSMPTFNNNIILAKSGTKLGVIAQGEAGDTSWPANVAFSKYMFDDIDASLNGDIFGYIE